MNKAKNKAIDRQGWVPVHVSLFFFYLSPFSLGYNGKGVRINP